MTEKNLNKHIIKSMLKTKDIGRDLYFFEECTSTFDEAAKLPVAHGSVICALKQTSGRGRLGREWSSETGGIYLSVIISPRMDISQMQIMTSVCAAAVRRAIAKLIPCYIKWPNDIISENGKKLCGILTKSSISGNNTNINVGIGVNTNIMSFPPKLSYAASIRQYTGYEIDENALLCDILYEIEKCCNVNDYHDIIMEYKENCVNLNRDVKIIFADGREGIKGRCTGITADGRLVIRKEDQSLVEVNSGEVSVKGIYGENYV